MDVHPDCALALEARAAKCAAGLAALLSQPAPAGVAAACSLVGFDALPDEAVLCACQAAARPEVGGRAAAAFVAAVLRPRLGATPARMSLADGAGTFSLLADAARPLTEEAIKAAEKAMAKAAAQAAGGGQAYLRTTQMSGAVQPVDVQPLQTSEVETLPE